MRKFFLNTHTDCVVMQNHIISTQQSLITGTLQVSLKTVLTTEKRSALIEMCDSVGLLNLA